MNKIPETKKERNDMVLQMTKETCDVCGTELIEEDGYLSCSVYMDGVEDNSDEHTSYPTNKSMINTRIIDTTIDTLGEGWDGNEFNVLANLNAIRQGIYDALPDAATDEDMEESFKLLWDLFGSDDTLMDDLTEDQIDSIVKRIV